MPLAPSEISTIQMVINTLTGPDIGALEAAAIEIEESPTLTLDDLPEPWLALVQPSVAASGADFSFNPQQARGPDGRWVDTPGAMLDKTAGVKVHPDRPYELATRLTVEAYNESIFARAFDGLDEVERAELAWQTQETLKQARDEGVHVNLTSDEFESVIRDGRFKTYAELSEGVRGGLKGEVYTHVRTSYEEQIMGVPTFAPINERPISGWGLTENHEDIFWNYGNISVLLKEETVKRTTWTIGDSLDRLVRPLWSDEIDTASEEELIAGSNWAINSLVTGDTPELSQGWEYGPFETGNINYIEAQVHGGITLADISYVQLNAEDAISDEAKEVLDANGISWGP